MRTLFCDIETFSPVQLAKAGVYPYAEHPDFELLLFGYSIDGGPVEIVDLASGETLPDEVLAALVDSGVVKWAHNAAFERVCLSAWLRTHHPELLADGFLGPRQWRCTMIWSAYLGLPMSLDAVATVLKLDVQKDSAGRKLIKQFCTPATPSVLNGGKHRNPPSADPTGWARFIDYNRRDVEVEQAIHDRLASFPMPDAEWDTYALDQRINDAGILLDHTLVDNAVAVDEHHRNATLARAQTLTGLKNPNSPIQLKQWLSEHGCELESLTKADVDAALDTATGEVKEVLELRGDLAKSSVKKYQAMQNVAGSDGRTRGLIQFYGAGRTGRFAGRLVQVQNLPRNYLPDLDQARSLVRTGSLDALELLYESVPDTLSQLIRTAFIPSPGHRFIVADFSAIEARVIAWLAGETTTLQAFREGKDLYCETASRMFGVPVEKHGVNGELRQKGKLAVLACGFGGSTGALERMGALTMGLAKHELNRSWTPGGKLTHTSCSSGQTSKKPLSLQSRCASRSGCGICDLPSSPGFSSSNSPQTDDLRMCSRVLGRTVGAAHPSPTPAPPPPENGDISKPTEGSWLRISCRRSLVICSWLACTQSPRQGTRL